MFNIETVDVSKTISNNKISYRLFKRVIDVFISILLIPLLIFFTILLLFFNIFF